MKKLLATLTTVAMLATSTVAFADVVVNNDGYNKTAGTYSVDTDLSGQTGQLTLLIIPEAAYQSGEIEDADILYIDQGAYTSTLFKNVGILGGTELTAGDYYVKIGGTNLTNDGIIVEKFTIAEENQGTPYTVGDVDGNGNITIGDVTALIDKLLYRIDYFTKGTDVIPYLVGDTDDNGSVTIGDVTTLIDKLLYRIENFDKTTYTLPAGTTAESTYPAN